MAYKRSIGEYVYMQNSDMLFKIYVFKVLHFLYNKSQREQKIGQAFMHIKSNQTLNFDGKHQSSYT